MPAATAIRRVGQWVISLLLRQSFIKNILVIIKHFKRPLNCFNADLFIFSYHYSFFHVFTFLSVLKATARFGSSDNGSAFYSDCTPLPVSNLTPVCLACIVASFKLSCV